MNRNQNGLKRNGSLVAAVALLLSVGLPPAGRADAFSRSPELDSLNRLLARPAKTSRQARKAKDPSAINKQTRKLLAAKEAVHESVLTRWPLQALALLFSPAGCGGIFESCSPEKVRITERYCTPFKYDGSDGSDAYSSYNGGRGDDGEDGQDLYVTAKVYDSQPAADGSVSQSLYIYVSPMVRPDAVLEAVLSWPLPPEEHLYIYSRGGDGGDGVGGSCSSRSGDGGDGGYGGYGGNVQVFYNDPAILNFLAIHVEGGDGGSGGYGTSCDGVSGYNGYTGSGGDKGRVIFTPEP